MPACVEGAHDVHQARALDDGDGGDEELAVEVGGFDANGCDARAARSQLGRRSRP